MEKNIAVALTREEDSSVQMGLKYLKRTCENWKTSFQMSGGFLLLAGLIREGVTKETQTAVLTAVSLAWATANAINAAGEGSFPEHRTLSNALMLTLFLSFQ